jgi:hypothetical protein
MTSYKKLACLLSTILLSNLPLFGQYSGTTTNGVYDGLATACSGSGEGYCFVNISNGTGQPTGLVSFSANMGTGGTMQFYGLDPSHNVWNFNYSNMTWQENAISNLSGNLRQIATGGNAYIFAIASSSAYPTNNVVQWNSGTSTWNALSGSGTSCTQLGVVTSGTGQGTLFGLVSGVVKYYSGSGWTSTANSETLTSFTVIQESPYMLGIGANNHLYSTASNQGSWTDRGLLQFTASSNPGVIAAQRDPNTSSLDVAIVDSSGNVWLSENSGTDWYAVQASGVNSIVTMAQANGPFQFLTADHGGIWVYTGMMQSITQQTSGIYNACPGCTTGVHTITAGASYPHGLHSGSQESQGQYNTELLASHQDYSPSCDIIFTYDDPECNVAITSTGTCPVMGTLLNISSHSLTPSLFKMDGHYKVTGDYEDCVSVDYIDDEECALPVEAWCSNGTPSPSVTNLKVLLTVTEGYSYLDGRVTLLGYSGGPWPLKLALGWPSNNSSKETCDLSPQPVTKVN